MTVTATLKTSGSSGSNTSPKSTASVTLTAGKLYLLAVAGSLDITSVSTSTESFTEVGAGDAGRVLVAEAPDRWLQVWKLLCATTHTDTIDMVQNSPNRAAWALIEFDGFDSADPFNSDNFNFDDNGESASTGFTVTIPGAFASADSVTFGAFTHIAAEAHTKDADYTELSNSAGAESSSLLTQWRAANDSTTSATWATSVRGIGFIIEIKAAATGVSGSAASTLPALTQSATGTTAVAGSAASTLPALSESATGAVAVSGSASSTLPALSQDADGTVDVVGSASSTLPALTQAATGTVGNPPISGEAASTLPALSSSATGEVPVAGAASSTLPALSSSATGTTEVRGSASSTLPALASSATGTAAIAGSAASSLPALSSSSSGTVSVVGSAAQTLPALVSEAQGVVGEAPAVGTAASLLPALQSSATGIVPVQGAASSLLPALVSSSAGGVEIVGTISSVLPALVAAATARTVVSVLGMVDSAGPPEGEWAPAGAPEGVWG